MKRTISVMVGPGSLRHNNRDFIAENVDPERMKDNIVYCNENIKDVYHELFDEALKKYNAKQTRKDRKIDNYYEKIRTGSQEKLFHEIILQVGNKDDMNVDSEEGQLAKKILDEYMRGFQDRNPNLRVFSAHLHMDETTPHLHIDFVPFTTGSKRGLETRVSLKKALAAQGFVGEGRRDTEWSRWTEAEKDELEKVMLKHDIEWNKLGTHNKHRTVSQFKKEMLESEVKELSEEKDLLESKIATYKNAEDYAVVTASSYETPEWLPPDPPAFMPAKAYVKKHVEPLIKKLIDVIKTLARRVYELTDEVKRLNGEINKLYAANERMHSSSLKLRFENEDLRREVRDYGRIKEYIGTDKVKEILKIMRHSRTRTR